MKKLLLILSCVALVLHAQAQTVIYQDDFEAYTVGGYLAVQSPYWTTWSNAPGTNEDAFIVTTQAYSPTKSVKIDGASDLLLPLGNKISGKYQIDFYYYVQAGSGAYFNFQRFESPGIQWVAEVFFANNGTGFIHAGGQNAATFTYPVSTWFLVRNIIDLDLDQAQLFINNVLIHTWQWSLTWNGLPSISQLGALNIYAGAPTGQTPNYWFDNISVIQLIEGTIPQVQVNPTEFMVTLATGVSGIDSLAVSNVGNATLDYTVEINYAFPTAKRTSILSSEDPPAGQKNQAMELIVDHTRPGGDASLTEEVILHYDGPNNGGVGFPNPAIFEVAARFPNSLTLPHAGMMLTKVDIYIFHTANCVFKIRIYGEGNEHEPGTLKHEQSIPGAFIGWNTITLTDPVMITGEDLWIGYHVAQAVGGIFPVGCDAGPAHPDGRFLKVGVGWTVSTLNVNWNIRGSLTGNGITQWLSVTPASGSLQPNDSKFHSLTFDATQLEIGDYAGVVKVKSNDIDDPVVVIPVTLDVVLGVNELGSHNAILVYPNPASEFIRIQANHQLNVVKLFNSTGQLVITRRIDGQTANIETSTLVPGIYLMQVESAAGILNRKVMVY